MKTEYHEKSPADSLSFNMMLDETCGRLEDARCRFSRRRIKKLEGLLDALEEELNSLLSGTGWSNQALAGFPGGAV